jgi:membrane protein YqaA with SNARE-associated domain
MGAMLRKTYDRVMALAGSRHAEPWLGVVSFVESSIFPIPPDAMLIPMVLARPQRAWVIASICTVASVLGGILGYAIGFFFAGWVEMVVQSLGWAAKLAQFKGWYAQYGVWVILIKGLTPFPYKIVTIASGLAHFDLKVFIFASILTRGLRFFLVAGLLKAFGAPIQAFVEKRLILVTSIVALVLIAAVVAIKLL